MKATTLYLVPLILFAFSGLALAVIPSAPSSIQTDVLGSRIVKVSWATPQIGMVRVFMQIDGAPDFSPSGKTSGSIGAIKIRSLKPGTKHCFKLQTISHGQLSPFSSPVCATTQNQAPLSGGVPLAPANLQAAAITRKSISIQWNSNEARLFYATVEESDVATGPFRVIGKVGKDARNYTRNVPNLSGRKRCFRVRNWINENQKIFTSQPSNTACLNPLSLVDIKKLPATPLSSSEKKAATKSPKSPKKVKLVEVSATQLQLSWKTVKGATGYRIERSENNGAYVLAGATAEDADTFTDYANKSGSSYCYRVVATNRIGSSAFSKVACGQLSPLNSKPVAVGAAGPALQMPTLAATAGPGNILLAWSDDPNQGRFAYTLQKGLSSTSMQDIKTLPLGQLFHLIPRGPKKITYYRLKVIDAANVEYVSNAVAVNATAPAPPSNLNANLTIPEIGPASIHLSWTRNSTNEAGVALQRVIIPRDAPKVRLSTIENLKPLTTQFTDKNALISGTYIYRILNFNSVGRSLSSNSVAVTLSFDPEYKPNAPFMKLPDLDEYHLVRFRPDINQTVTESRHVISDLAISTMAHKIYTMEMIKANSEPFLGVAIDPTHAPYRVCTATSPDTVYAKAKTIEDAAWTTAFQQTYEYINLMKTKFNAMTTDELAALPGLKATQKIKKGHPLEGFYEFKSNFSTPGGWFAMYPPPDEPVAAGEVPKSPIPVIGQTLSVQKNITVPSHLLIYGDAYIRNNLKRTLNAQGVTLGMARKIMKLNAKKVKDWQAVFATQGAVSAAPLLKVPRLTIDFFKAQYQSDYCVK